MAIAEKLTVTETARLLRQTAVREAAEINRLYRVTRKRGKHTFTLAPESRHPVILVVDVGKGGNSEIHTTKKGVWLGVRGVTQMRTGGRLIHERPATRRSRYELMGDGIAGKPRVSRVGPRQLFYIESSVKHDHRPVPGARKSALLIAKVAARS